MKSRLFARFLKYALACVFLILASSGARAAPQPAIDYLMEGSQPLDLQTAVGLYDSGKFKHQLLSAPDFGIGSNPVWMHLSVSHSADTAVREYLLAGVTWLDHVDVYALNSGKLENEIHTGDETVRAPGLTPALGFALPLPQDCSDLYLRVSSIDPMILPLSRVTESRLNELKIHYGYFYGFFYGYLAALCIYNLLLFAGLGERSYLYYSLALLSAIFCNASYTGHGAAWLWPGYPLFQRYVILVMMVLYSVLGLLFASRFLALAENAPRALRAIKWFSGTALTAMFLFVLAGSQLGADLLAFSTVAIFSVSVFLLGLLMVKKGLPSGRYFLAATFFGFFGVVVTDLAVWGKIPFTALSFHSFELGLVIEATLLALALAFRMRQYQEANQKAEKLAREDPLTGLSNRRAFMELAGVLWSSADRGQRSLTLIMMDIDHFKDINDRHGHKIGDDVLTRIGSLLRRFSRSSDIVARWGGEEFILLLTETDLDHALSYAESLKQSISELRIHAGHQIISLSASLGVARCTTDSTLEEMIHLADAQLYRAKSEGRNRVCSHS
ncbi:MAG: GGDEF domain-containing protein [Betaproteobacteria bacterium]|nr:GGDEF domain-containing protein [Betaproteobacteria bacterium]